MTEKIKIICINLIFRTRTCWGVCVSPPFNTSLFSLFHATPLNFFTLFHSCALKNTHLMMCARVFVCKFLQRYFRAFYLIKIFRVIKFISSSIKPRWKPLFQLRMSVRKTRHKVYLCTTTTMMIILGWKVFLRQWKEIFINSDITYIDVEDLIENIFIILFCLLFSSALFFFLFFFSSLADASSSTWENVNEVGVNEEKFSWECELRCDAMRCWVMVEGLLTCSCV